MKIGFIGAGSMGSLLIESFIMSEAIEPSQIRVSNRTYAKAQALAQRFPGLSAEASNVSVVISADIVFLCIKPHEFAAVTREIKRYLTRDQIIVSITSPVLIAQLEHELESKIAKIIPSITNKMWSGATLCIYGNRMTEVDQEKLEKLLRYISEPLKIEESFTRVVSDISSIGPAFFSFLLQQFIDAAVEETGISRQGAMTIASNMILGTGLLLTEGGMTTEDVQKRVAVPGGITAQALTLLAHETTGIFNKLIRVTHAKYYEDLEKVNQTFNKEEVSES